MVTEREALIEKNEKADLALNELMRECENAGIEKVEFNDLVEATKGLKPVDLNKIIQAMNKVIEALEPEGDGKVLNNENNCDS